MIKLTTEKLKDTKIKKQINIAHVTALTCDPLCCLSHICLNYIEDLYFYIFSFNQQHIYSDLLQLLSSSAANVFRLDPSNSPNST